jgi:LysR family glycine cleavage system transcriptional activator
MPAKVIPRLTALRAFEAAARHLSFRAAAEELHITQSAVSHQISNLEETLGVQLFRRLPGRIDLSDAGQLYYPFLRDAFDRIARGTSLVSRIGVTGGLTMQVYTTVAVKWLMPRLHRFHARQPDIVVSLDASRFDWDFDPDTADIGMIYTADAERPTLHLTHLFDARLVTVCSPSFAPKLGGAADLPDHPMLQTYTAAEDWGVWLAAAKLPAVAGRAAPTFDSYLLAIEAAIDGQGVAVAPHFLVAGDLRGGRLVKAFEIEARQPGSWYLACAKTRRREPRIERFRNWLIEEVAEDPALR